MTPEERGQYPLGVEGAIAFHARNLVPFTTTVTAHPRYYALHAAAALREDPSSDTAGELTRRLEVLLAAASMLHARGDMPGHDPAAALSEPHGFRAVGSALGGADLDLSELARTYGGNRSYGYSGAYFGVEQAFGLSGGAKARMPLDAGDLASFEPLVALAAHDTVPLAELNHPALCLCATRTSSDGEALRTAFFDADDPAAPDDIRAARLAGQNSAALCVTALRGKSTAMPVTVALADLCVYGDVAAKLPDPELTAAAAARWRGALLRNESVTAWRWLWAWVTQTLNTTPGTEKELSEALAATLLAAAGGDLTYTQAVLAPIPEGRDAAGFLRPAEQKLRATTGLTYGSEPLLWLRMLALGSRRLDELDDSAREHFIVGADSWNPLDTREYLLSLQELRLSKIAGDLAPRLVRRAQQIARRRQQWTRDGLRMPTKLRPVGDILYVSGPDGTGEAALRQFRLQQMLSAFGILDVSDGAWTDGPHVTAVLR